MRTVKMLFALIALMTAVSGMAACATARSGSTSGDFAWIEHRHDP